MACLCAPTSHEGSFRCRLHRGLSPTSYHALKGFNYCPDSTNAYLEPICCNPPVAHLHSPSLSVSASAIHPPRLDDRVCLSHAPQVPATDRLSSLHIHSSSCRSSSSSALSWSSSSSRLSPSSFSASLLSSSSRASASSASSSSSSLPVRCMQPPPPRRTSSSSSSSSQLAAPSYSWCGANGTTPSASHAAATAIMKQHSHNKGARTHNRNIFNPTSASKIGPSRLSRMAAACADKFPPLKSAAVQTETESFKAKPSIGAKTSAAVFKFKQSEFPCRTVGSNGGPVIVPAVY